jgi:hypothetical protein
MHQRRPVARLWLERAQRILDVKSDLAGFGKLAAPLR